MRGWRAVGQARCDGFGASCLRPLTRSRTHEHAQTHNTPTREQSLPHRPDGGQQRGQRLEVGRGRVDGKPVGGLQARHHLLSRGVGGRGPRLGAGHLVERRGGVCCAARASVLWGGGGEGFGGCGGWHARARARPRARAASAAALARAAPAAHFALPTAANSFGSRGFRAGFLCGPRWWARAGFGSGLKRAQFIAPKINHLHYLLQMCTCHGHVGQQHDRCALHTRFAGFAMRKRWINVIYMNNIAHYLGMGWPARVASVGLGHVDIRRRAFPSRDGSNQQGGAAGMNYAEFRRLSVADRELCGARRPRRARRVPARGTAMGVTRRVVCVTGDSFGASRSHRRAHASVVP